MSMTGSTPAALAANKTGIFSDVSGKKVLTALQQLERNLNAFSFPPLPSSSSTTSATASAHTSPGNADYAAESVVERVVAMKSGSFIEPKKEFSNE